MRRVPSLPFQAPVASDNAAPQPESFRGRRSSKKSRLAAVRNMSSAYLTNTTNQSTYQPEGPQQYHPRPPSQSSTIYAPVPFFSKLKSISRAKSPIDAASLYSYTEPQSPGSIAGSVTPWSSDTAISTSPAQKKGGILSKKSLQRTTSGPDDEFDPTTLRQNRTWPRKNPEDIYHAYDDLFADDSVEESDLGEVDMPNTRDTHSVGSGDEYYPQQGLRQGNIRTPPKPQTPPRSAPSPRLDQYMANDYRRSPSPSLPQWRQLSETSTPPQSKPPSVVDCPVTSTAQPLYALPPTPPPKSTSPVQDQSGMERRSLSPLRVDGPLSLSPTELEDAIASPGPPPGHALPPVPPTRTSSKAKWGLKRSSMRRNDSKRLRDLEEGLGITNIQPSTMYPSEQSPPTETWEQSIGYSSEEGSAGDSTGVVSQSVISEIVYTHPGNETPSLLLNSSADFDTLPLFSQRASQPSSETIMGPEIISLAIGNSGKPPSTLRHRIPRKQVRSPQKAKALLDGFMSEARDISKLNEHTGYMPQMRIVDVQDIDSGFGYSNYKDTPVASPNTDTMKEVVSSSPEPALASAGMDTKEVVFEQPTVTGNTSGTEQGKEAEGEELCEVIEKPTGHDTTHYRVFRQFLKTSGENDAFIHRFPRFDALQAQRICTHLREEYPLVPKQNGEAAKASSKTRKMVRQREIGDQMLTSMWGLMAFRWLMFGRVILSPAYEGLAAASAERLSKRSSAKSKGSATGMIGSMTSDERAEGVRSRVLDLGGNPIGDWAWHCAYDYPKSKVYTVTARPRISSTSTVKSQRPGSPTQNSHILGPKNHRHITVPYLWRLPFPDNHFDVVSARSLYTTLKVHARSNRNSPIIDNQSPLSIMDEYDMCLEECLRVLKPGGYLEFFIFDSDIIKPGPLGTEFSIKFAEELEANGYDPSPSRKWIHRLNKTGFGDIKRAWVFVPMAPQVKPKPPAKEDEYEVVKRTPSQEHLEAMKEEVRKKMEAWEDLGVKKGSTENAAPVSGLLGSWVWERWMLKTRQETQHATQWELAVDTMGAVLEEGKERGSGWRALVGWARKPLIAPHSHRFQFGARSRAVSGESMFAVKR